MTPPETAGARHVLSPDQAQTVLRSDAANLISKVKAGKPLSSSERKHLLDITAGGNGSGPTFVSSLAELAEVLTVDRRTLTRWKRAKGAPKSRPDGRHDVEAWRVFKGTRKAGIRDGDLDPKDEKARQIVLQNEKLETQVEILKRLWIRREEVEADVARMCLAAKSVLLSLPSALAPQVVGSSVPEAEAMIREAVNGALAQLQQHPLGEENRVELEPEGEA